VRHYLDRIDDPVLAGQVRDFIYQEAVHSRVHGESNEAVKRALHYGSEMEKVCEFLFVKVGRFTPWASQLATSCAMEHFTAIFSDTLLRNQDHFASHYEPNFAAMWLWHAVEETEHKAVCFDVYDKIYGRGPLAWLHRVAVMAWVTLLGLIFIPPLFYLVSRKQRRAAQESGEGAAPRAKASLKFFLQSPLKMYFEYYKPSFHPWQQDNAYLVTKWKATSANYPGITEMPARQTAA
jgi:predicted metal-dependent hydrolase